jgi:hypothetical protein
MTRPPGAGRTQNQPMYDRRKTHLALRDCEDSSLGAKIALTSSGISWDATQGETEDETERVREPL